MSVEQSQNFQENRDKYKDFRNALSDAHLDKDETDKLLKKYYDEVKDMHQGTKSKYEELGDDVKLYKELRSISRIDKKKIQVLAGLHDDGLVGPDTYASIQEMLRSSSNSQYESLSDVISDYDTKYSQYQEKFSSLPLSHRKELQRRGQRDGKFGPNTFKYIILNERAGEELFVKFGAVESLETGSPEAIDNPALQKQKEPQYHNGLGMSEQDFTAAKKEILKIGKNPSYKEFKREIQKMDSKDKMKFQTMIGAKVDGVPGLGSYLHYMNSKFHDAKFSPLEIVGFKQVISENGKDEIQNIQDAYGVVLDIPDNMPSIDDRFYFSYDPDYGSLLLFNLSSGDAEVYDIADGKFDTIQDAFVDGETEAIFETLTSFGTNREDKKRYIEAIKKYIIDNSGFDRAREIFSKTPEKKEEGEVFTLDFRGDKMLENSMSAIDIFGDQEYLLRPNNTYIQRYDPNGGFKTIHGKPLFIKSGTSLLVPNTEKKDEIHKHMQVLEKKKQVVEAVEKNLVTTLKNNDSETIFSYFESSTEKKQKIALKNIKKVILSQKLFSSARSIFADESGGQYTFNTRGNKVLSKGLTAFDLFGDYKKLKSAGKTYTEGGYSYYEKVKRLSLQNGITSVSLPEAKYKRTSQDYKAIQAKINNASNTPSKSIENLSERWKRIYDEFLQKGGLTKRETNDVQKGNRPLALTDPKSRKLLFVDGKNTYEVDVILGENGTTTGQYIKNDKKTPVGKTHRFNLYKKATYKKEYNISGTIHTEYLPADNAAWRNLKWNNNVKSYYGEKWSNTKGRWEKGKRVTVVAGSCQSGLASQFGGRYYHIVGPNREFSWGCVGIMWEDRAIAKTMFAKLASKKGLGYASAS